MVALVGANGAGKTTLLKTISGLVHAALGHGGAGRQAALGALVGRARAARASRTFPKAVRSSATSPSPRTSRSARTRNSGTISKEELTRARGRGLPHLPDPQGARTAARRRPVGRPAADARDRPRADAQAEAAAARRAVARALADAGHRNLPRPRDAARNRLFDSALRAERALEPRDRRSRLRDRNRQDRARRHRRRTARQFRHHGALSRRRDVERSISRTIRPRTNSPANCASIVGMPPPSVCVDPLARAARRRSALSTMQPASARAAFRPAAACRSSCCTAAAAMPKRSRATSSRSAHEFDARAIDYYGHGLTGLERAARHDGCLRQAPHRLHGCGRHRARASDRRVARRFDRGVDGDRTSRARRQNHLHASARTSRFRPTKRRRSKTDAGLGEFRRLTKQFVANPTRENVHARLRWLFHKPERDITEELIDLRWALYQHSVGKAGNAADERESRAPADARESRAHHGADAVSVDRPQSVAASRDCAKRR